MMRKLISIAFAINIIWFSIGVQVMQHHCIWCGGDRIEIVTHSEPAEDGSSCCATTEAPRQGCEDDGCCQPDLLKLTNGVATEDAFGIRADLAPSGLDMLFPAFTLHGLTAKAVSNDLRDNRGSPFLSPPTAFLVPLRC